MTFSGVMHKLPAWTPTDETGKRPEGAPRDAALWSGAPRLKDPPAIGSRVIAFGGFGPSTVEGYFLEHGYLGVALRPDERPAWHMRQNPDRHVVLLFGLELQGHEPVATAPEWRHTDGHSTAHLYKPVASVSQCSSIPRERSTPSTHRAHCKRCERSAAAQRRG